MTEKEFKTIEKTLIERVNTTEVGSADHKTAMAELLKFTQQHEEIRKNRAHEELERFKARNDLEKLKSQEAMALAQRNLDEKKLQQEKELAEKANLIEMDKINTENRSSKLGLIGTIFGGIMTFVAGICTTVVGYKLYDQQATKAYQFEETGTISSFTSKQILGGMRPPKK